VGLEGVGVVGTDVVCFLVVVLAVVVFFVAVVVFLVAVVFFVVVFIRVQSFVGVHSKDASGLP
jgi:hypothetical protein